MYSLIFKQGQEEDNDSEKMYYYAEFLAKTYPDKTILYVSGCEGFRPKGIDKSNIPSNIKFITYQQFKSVQSIPNDNFFAVILNLNYYIENYLHIKGYCMVVNGENRII